MTNMMGTTSKIVGPPEGAQALPVVRLKSLNLETQLDRETTGCARRSAKLLSPLQRLSQVLPLLLVLGLMLPCLTLNAVEDTYTVESERAPKVDYYYQEKNKQGASERQEQFRKRVSIQHAVGDDVPLAFEKTTVANPSRQLPQPSNESDGIMGQGVLLIVATLLSSILAVSVLVPGFFRKTFIRLKPWSGRTGVVTGVADTVRAEDKYFAEFLTTFQAGTSAPPAGVNTGSNGPSSDQQRFHATAARLVSSQRSLLQSIVNTTSDAVRVRLLGDLRRELNAFKNESVSPEFLPAWQMASALEGLLKQLTDKAGNATQSTLRTVARGIQLLGELSKPGVRRDILTQPPLRFLTVDDDMISRTAVALALKKVFNQPDLADNGTVALALVARNNYDVIFLDVQMPGMDGYEVCTKIHETSANKQTPVIFVTCMDDFHARAKSVLANGSDLIAKPFLTFEITVKALTLALERRIKTDAEPLAGSDGGVVVDKASPGSTVADNTDVAASIQPVAQEKHLEATLLKSSTDDGRISLSVPGMDEMSNEVVESRDTIENVFMSRVATKLALLKDLIRSVSDKTDKITRQEMLAEFFLGLEALSSEVDTDVNQSVKRVSGPLEGLVRKLLESPDNWTQTTLLTISNAVELIDDLCAHGSSPDFIAEFPVQILAVDDDPISLRAMASALQVAFKKPVGVESGDAAVLIASERKFDLIFMDVQMPGMNGFETCSKIRNTEINARTPVVFVTGQNDSHTRNQVAASGGEGVIAKPFLTAELTVKALTVVLRGRIEQAASHGVPPSVEDCQANLVANV